MAYMPSNMTQSYRSLPQPAGFCSMPPIQAVQGYGQGYGSPVSNGRAPMHPYGSPQQSSTYSRPQIGHPQSTTGPQVMPLMQTQNHGPQQCLSGDTNSLLQDLQNKGQDLELSKDFLVRQRMNLQQQRKLLEEELQTLRNARDVDLKTAREVDRAVAEELQQKTQEALMFKEELKNMESQNTYLYADQRQRVDSETVVIAAAQRRMQDHNVYLSQQLDQIKAEAQALTVEKDSLVQAEQQPPPMAVASGGTTDTLRATHENRRLAEENAELRSALACGRLRLERCRRTIAEVEVTSQRVEVKIVERCTREKQRQLIEERVRLEAELQAREAGLRDRYEAKQKQVTQVERLTMQVECSKVMSDLVDRLNARQREISQLKRQLYPSMVKRPSTVKL